MIGDPGVITVSAGPDITLQDLKKFDAHWMQPAQRQVAYERAYWNLYQRNVSIVWEAGERMTTLVRMYELTHDTRYLTICTSLPKRRCCFATTITRAISMPPATAPGPGTR